MCKSRRLMREIAIRRLWPADGAELRNHLLRLDWASRVSRFGGQLADAVVSRYADSVDWAGDVVVGAFCGPILRGVAEVRRTGLLAGELAMSVEPSFQNHGIGTRLFGRAALAARNSLVTDLTVFCQVGNRRMVRIVRRYAVPLRSDRSDLTGTLVEPPPDVVSLCLEAAAELTALASGAPPPLPRLGPY